MSPWYRFAYPVCNPIDLFWKTGIGTAMIHAKKAVTPKFPGDIPRPERADSRRPFFHGVKNPFGVCPFRNGSMNP